MEPLNSNIAIEPLRSRPRTSKCVLEAKDVLEDSTSDENMVADIFTKALSKPRFEKLHACLGLEPLFSPHTN